MKTLLVLLIAAGFIYFLFFTNRKSRPSHEEFWEKNRNNKVQTTQSQSSSKQIPASMDVVESLSKSSLSDDTYHYEEKFEEMIDKCIEKNQKNKLENILHKAFENFPDHIKERVHDSLFSGLEVLIEFYQDDNDVKKFLKLIHGDSMLSREIVRLLGKHRLAEAMSHMLYDYFQKDADETFSKLKKNVNMDSDILDMAIEKFLQENQKDILQIRQDVEKEKKTQEVKSKGESKLKSIIKKKTQDFESYSTKQYVVFHLKGEKNKWFIRFHNKRTVPLVEFNNGDKLQVSTLEEFDMIEENILNSLSFQ